MEYTFLGNSGIYVSKICFGSLTIGPLQKNLSLLDGSHIIERAIDKGINFIDTADLYNTYAYIKKAISYKKDLVVASRSYAYDIKTAKDSLGRALKETGRDYIDIFGLHEQEGPLTLKGHEEALEFFIRQKEKGYIRAIAISTHFIAAVKAASMMNEIDIIFPILNYKGLGIVDGTRFEMEQAIARAYQMGKGIYTMKPLGGGHLIRDYKKALDYITDFPYIHSVAIGMQREEEVDANAYYFENKDIPDKLYSKLKQYDRKLIIGYWCESCGACVERCKQGALSMSEHGAVVDNSKCILCGYCGSVCKENAIKII